MPDLPRATPAHQIWITRGHLAALAVATTAIAVLAFLVGFQVGRGKSGATDAAEAPPTAAFLPDATDQEALEALLREVERAQQPSDPSQAPRDVTFNHDLPHEVPSEIPTAPPAPQVDSLVAGDPAAAPSPPVDPGPGAPTSGWAVQIASYAGAAEADAHVAALQEQDLAAYRVAALVDGATWYRVKVGGFSSREEASEQRGELATRLGLEDLVVSPAP